MKEKTNGAASKPKRADKQDPTDKPKPKINPLLLMLIVGNMQSAGLMLQSQDENTTGTDDVAGMLLTAGAEAFSGYVQSDAGKMDRAMIAVNKSSAAYCKSRGLPVAA
jgi:hypothetical protein